MSVQGQAVEARTDVECSGAVPGPSAAPEMAVDLLSEHVPGIDVLRGMAVLAVVIFHGMAYRAPNVEWGNRVADRLYGLTAWGWLGVNLFFVISGFLITGILDDTVEREKFYRRFYIRRALRILPAYLAVIGLAFATGFVTPNYILICLLFLANMPGAFLHHGYLFYGPFWSLAVEEQFYLVWPMLYRRLRRRVIFVVSLGLLVVCPVLRALAFAHLLHTGDAFSKTWMIADNLAIGAVLAILVRSPRVTLRLFAALGWMQCFAGLAGLAILFAAHRMGTQDVLRNSMGLSCFLLLASSAVVGVLCLFRRRALPKWMRIFVFFGDISYGLYLVHLLLLHVYDRIFGLAFEANWRLLLLRFAVANGVAVGLAFGSKRLFEDPILRLKSKIEAAR